MAAKRKGGSPSKKSDISTPAQQIEHKVKGSLHGKEGAAASKQRSAKRKDGRPAGAISKPDKAHVSQDTKRQSVLVAFQRCRAVRWRPYPVVAISVCPDQSAVAVARENGGIELWDSNTWTLVLAMPGKEEASITAMCWVRDSVTTSWRLFSCGLDTLIVEWQLQHRRPLHAASSLGGAVWHMAAQPQNLQARSDESSEFQDPVVAVATDDGAVRLHTVEPGTPGMQLRKALTHADARALHVMWREDGLVLYGAFSNGCISIFDVSAGTETLRITAATRAGGQPACIWSLAALPGGLLASASSKGVVQTFETQFGTLQSTCHHHQADVTCLATTPCGSNLYAAGVDPSLALLTPAPAPSTDPDAPARYQLADRRRPHNRDVRAMAVVTPGGSSGTKQQNKQSDSVSWLLTGGNDAQLLMHSAQPFQSMHSARVCAAPCAPLLAFSPSGTFLAADGMSVDVWRSADAPSAHEKGKSVAQEGERLAAKRPPGLLARLLAEPDQAPVCAAMSQCGHFAAVSTSEGTSLLAISAAAVDGTATINGDREFEGYESSVIAVVRVQEPLPAACSLCFVQCNSPMNEEHQQDGNGTQHEAAEQPQQKQQCWLLLGCMNGDLLSMHIDTTCDHALGPPVKVDLPEEDTLRTAVSLKPSFALASEQIQPPFTHVAASPCGGTVALATPNAVHILHWQHSSQSHSRLEASGCLALPHSPSQRPITALALAPTKSVLAISTTDVRLELYDTETLTQLDWLQNTPGVYAKLDTLNGHVHSLCFRPCRGVKSSNGTLMVCSATHVCHLCLDAVAAGPKLSGAGIVKRHRAKGRPSAVSDPAGSAVRVIDAQAVVLGAEWVGEDCFMLVQGNWEGASQCLPPPLILKVFGGGG